MTDVPLRRPLNIYNARDLGEFTLHVDDMAPPPCALTDNPALVALWIKQIGPIETQLLTDIHCDIVALMRDNGAALNGSRHWLGIDGPPLMGKTQCTVVAALRIGDYLRRNQPDDATPPFHHTPVVVVSGDLGERALARALLDKIAHFVGVQLPSRGGFAGALATLAILLRNLGTMLVVVDDAHYIKRKTGTRELTDHLKEIITTLPATFVFVGAGLSHSALLHVPSERATRGPALNGPAETDSERAFRTSQYSAVEQLRLRMLCRLVLPFPTEQYNVPADGFVTAMSAMVDQLDRIDAFDPQYLRTKTAMKQLNRRAHGRTGHGFKLIVRIASVAAEHGVSPTKKHVNAVTGRPGVEIDHA